MVDINTLRQLEGYWHIQGVATEPETYFGWEPYDLDQFWQLLQGCIPHVPADRQSFVDIGCGIGTKCLLAQNAGLAVFGVERVPTYVAEAQRLGVEVWQGLAQDFTQYDQYGLVYVNHPMASGGNTEALLENSIQSSMASGSVLMSVNYDLAPGCPHHPPTSPCSEACGGASSWPEIARINDWAAAWIKP
jgi:SAM-dependent methyltransferase